MLIKPTLSYSILNLLKTFYVILCFIQSSLYVLFSSQNQYGLTSNVGLCGSGVEVHIHCSIAGLRLWLWLRIRFRVRVSLSLSLSLILSHTSLAILQSSVRALLHQTRPMLPDYISVLWYSGCLNQKCQLDWFDELRTKLYLLIRVKSSSIFMSSRLSGYADLTLSIDRFPNIFIKNMHIHEPQTTILNSEH